MTCQVPMANDQAPITKAKGSSASSLLLWSLVLFLVIASLVIRHSPDQLPPRRSLALTPRADSRRSADSLVRALICPNFSENADKAVRAPFIRFLNQPCPLPSLASPPRLCSPLTFPFSGRYPRYNLCKS